MLRKERKWNHIWCSSKTTKDRRVEDKNKNQKNKNKTKKTKSNEQKQQIENSSKYDRY